MKTTLITTALLLSSVIVTAQEKKQTIVHIKKIENINGIETVVDTSYGTMDGTFDITELKNAKPGEITKTIVI